MFRGHRRAVQENGPQRPDLPVEEPGRTGREQPPLLQEHPFLHVEPHVWRVLPHQRLLQAVAGRPLHPLGAVHVRPCHPRRVPHRRRHPGRHPPWLPLAHRLPRHAPAMVVWHLDEPHDLFLCPGGGGHLCAPAGGALPLRRDTPRHWLVQARLALRMEIQPRAFPRPRSLHPTARRKRVQGVALAVALRGQGSRATGRSPGQPLYQHAVERTSR